MNPEPSKEELEKMALEISRMPYGAAVALLTMTHDILRRDLREQVNKLAAELKEAESKHEGFMKFESSLTAANVPGLKMDVPRYS